MSKPQQIEEEWLYEITQKNNLISLCIGEIWLSEKQTFVYHEI